MNISTVTIVLQRQNDGQGIDHSDRISLTATADGLMMSLFGKTIPVKDKSIFTTWYSNLSKIECANYTILSVTNTDEYEVYESMNDLDDMTKLRKMAESNDKITNDDECDWDYDTPMVFRWYYANTIVPFLEEVEKTVNHLKKIKEIVGLECPVFSEPLTAENARKFSKCSHWISERALDGILRTKTTAEIKCPMCRQEHYRSDIESI